ncbi:MAG: hypothetical protein JXC32_13590 [Anaerolineae bacterium]|nr:hypothetical protein [Anaerolineae bacterium]
MGPSTEYLDTLSREIRESEAPPSLDHLVTRLATLILQRAPTLWRAPTPSGAPMYSPGASYRVGDRVSYGGDIVEVVAVRRRWNPRQGTFSVVELTTPDGSMRRLVADLPNTSVKRAIQDETAGDVAAFVALHGDILREALLADPRFADVPGAGEALSDIQAPSGSRMAASSTTTRATRPRGLFCERILLDHVGDLDTSDNVLQAEPDVGDLPSGLLPGLRRLLGPAATAGGAWDAGETWQRVVLPALRLLGWSAAGQSAGGCYSLLARLGRADSEGPAPTDSPVVVVRPVAWAADLGSGGGDSSEGCPVIELVGRLVSDDFAWGILTNGREWRLYRSSRKDPDVGCTAAETYQIDLAAVVGSAPPDGGGPSTLRESYREALMLWWQLFQAESFVSSDLTPSVVEDLKRESAAHAWRTTQQLRTQLVERVLPEIAGGFIAYRHQQLGLSVETLRDDESGLADVMRSSLGLAARLLFILYAESRSMLPVHNPDYRGESLQTMQRWAMAQVRGDRPLNQSTQTTPRYDDLLGLFRQLEHGTARMGLPSYSNGLFSPLDPVCAFLERHCLSDRVVARTLAALGEVRGETGNDDEIVDYTGLSIRHLSALFEGLADSSLWIVEAPAGQVAMMSDRGLPLSAGGVPVPDYVGVSSIERTLYQVLVEREEAFTKAMDGAVALRKQMETAGVAMAGSSAALEASLQAAEKAASDALLNLRVLDPATRGGALLVWALDIVTDGLLGILAGYHAAHPHIPWHWDPVCREIQATIAALRTEVAAQGLPQDALHIDAADVLTRMITEGSLYGVDRNAIAIALATTNVQMRAFVPGAPFPSLDRHLRCGNSLCGLRLSEVTSEAPVFANLQSDLIGALTAALAEGKTHGSAEGLLQPYEALLTLWLSERYGNRGAQDLVCRLGPELVAALRGEASLTPDDAEIVEAARRLAEDHGFFHWDLAFPRVFLVPERRPPTAAQGRPFDVAQAGSYSASQTPMLDQAGFDIVMGRPPSSSELGSAATPEPGIGYALLFSRERKGPFTELANQLLRRPGGKVAYVIRPSEEVT